MTTRPQETQARAAEEPEESGIRYNPGGPPFTGRRRTERVQPRNAQPDAPEPEDEDPENTDPDGTDPDWDGNEEEGRVPEAGDSMGIAEFIEAYKDPIARMVTEVYRPRYQPAEAGNEESIPALLRPPLGAQEHALRGAALCLRENRSLLVIGEMGVGKTYIALGAAHAAGMRNILVICPPHLVQKWKREVEMTIPGARARIVHRITDLKQLPQPDDGGPPSITIMSRETAKLSYRWEPAYLQRRGRKTCPECFARLTDKDGIELSDNALGKKRMKCPECQGALWQPRREGHRKDCPCAECTGVPGKPAQHKHRKFALADYVKKHMKGFFDLLVLDEVHEYKSRGSGQGIAAGNLAEVCGKVMTLTGTLMGGYSSTLFYLLYRFSPDVREEFQHNQVGRWIDRYGFRQKKFRTDPGGDDLVEHGRGSSRRGYKVRERETPGLAPAALFHIIGNTVFLRLADVSSRLPPYEEQIIVQELDGEIDEAVGLSHRTAYNHLYQQLRTAMTDALRRGSNRLMAAYLQSLLAYPDGCTLGERVTDPRDDEIIADIPPLSGERTYPKERALVELIREEKSRGRRVLVYATHTDTRDITPRLEEVLQAEGFRTSVLRSNSPKSERREAWVADRVKEGIDVLICNPRLVQTGLDLVDFPTICWYETEYSVYTMRQASRRSWRIGQDQPVRVVFMVYDGTIQTDALKLIARKMQSSLAVEGDLPEDGLTTFGDDAEDLIMTLARQIVNDEGFRTAGSLERIFQVARDAEREGERYLVDEEWYAPEARDEPGAEAQLPDGPAPQDEPAPGGEPVPGGEPAAETPAEPAPKTAIVSWTEFMAEPPQPRRGRRRAAPEAPSLFQWAVEQEEMAGREEER